MKRRGLLKQLLLFCAVGFCVVSMYNSFTSYKNAILSLQINSYRELLPTWTTSQTVSSLIHLRKTIPVNCGKIIEGDEAEIAKAIVYMKKRPPVRLKDEDFVSMSQNCGHFRSSMRYDIYPITDEERNFPIAFSIITYKDVDQTERLLRAIYRPQNFYCLHVDKSAPGSVHNALKGIAGCFKNVFIVSKNEDIIYNHMTRLKADLNCMSDLLSYKWKYFVNLPHQQFPLKTNLELVKIFRIYNGANDIEGIVRQGRMMHNRFKFKFKYINNTWVKLELNKNKLPNNASIVKGSAYGVFSRAFVQYIINSQEAKDVLNFMEDVKSPDEYYWATLNHNAALHAPGRYIARRDECPESYCHDPIVGVGNTYACSIQTSSTRMFIFGNPEKKPWLAVYASWGGSDRCHGKFVRAVCVFGVGDLNELVSKKELFANKFHADYQPYALDCLEEYMYNKSLSNELFETFYYRQLPFVIKDQKN